MRGLLLQTNWILLQCISLTLLSSTPHSAKDIKHKISFLLQKPEPQTAEQKQLKEKNAVAAAAAAGKRSDNLILFGLIVVLARKSLLKSLKNSLE